MIDSRKKRLLGLIVEEYIKTARPVSSKYLAETYDLGVSPATIRNDEYELEQFDFIYQPHTSAGRVPTDKGYRYYVDYLMEAEEVSLYERQIIEAQFGYFRRHLEELLPGFCKLLAVFTRCLALATCSPNLEALLRYLSLKALIYDTIYNNVAGEKKRLGSQILKLLKRGKFPKLRPKVYISGGSVLAELPELEDRQKFYRLLRFLEEDETLLNLLNSLSLEQQVIIHIGAESRLTELWDYSLLASPFAINKEFSGVLAVIGPKRMRYSKALPTLKYLAESLSQILNSLVSDELMS